MTNPQTIGDYQIIKELGRGAFGVVYQARDPALKRTVALKVLHPYHSDPAFIERFKREAETAAQFDHPHIVTVYTVGEADGRHYLAMAYLEGRTLAQQLRDDPPPVDRALAIIDQVAGALDAVHARDLTHRDVKSRNIMLAPDGRAVLLDFGLVRAAAGTQLTQTGDTLGSPDYMAPEQVEPALGAITPRTDVYALGVVAYELLTGRLPFIADSPLQVMYQHAHADPPPPTEIKPDFPAGLAPPLLKALAKAPADRYAGAGRLAADLQAAWQAEQRAGRLRPLYEQFQAAYRRHDWSEALALGGQIRAQDPDYRDVAQLMAEARRQRQPRPSRETSTPGIPRWLWGVGAALVVAACLVGLSLRGLAGWFIADSTPTPADVIGREVSTGPTAPSTDAVIPQPEESPTSTSTPLPSNFEPGATQVRDADGMTMVYVPAGSFQMGSDDSDSLAGDDEKPQHSVTLEAFWIDQTEVTNAQYDRCVEAGVCETGLYADDSNLNGADYPVVGVSWYDAVAYCRWAGGRLPTKAEREYAARGPDSRRYPWGNEFDGEKVNFCDQNCEYSHKDEAYDDGYQWTAPVGSYPDGQSWVGALDIAGNVWEWVQSEYQDYPYQVDDGRENLNSTNVRALRGGGWDSSERDVRAANRLSGPVFSVSKFGFRCVVSPGN